MLRSMTGFSRVELGVDGHRVVWELKCVNHRYCEVQARLPEAFAFFEPQLRKMIQAKLARGKCTASLTLVTDVESKDLSVNQPYVDLILSQVAKWGDHPHVSDRVDPLDLLRMPGVIAQAKTEGDALAEGVREALTEAIEALLVMRSSEGAQLSQVLKDRCQAMYALLEGIEPARAEFETAQRNKLIEKCKEAQVELAPERFEQEVVLWLGKSDIQEEVDRLMAHIAAFEQALASEKPIGRRLDFLTQEMNREANTLSSKAADIRLTQIALDLKVLIEQIREQVQNIE